jgi:hypothetical protein
MLRADAGGVRVMVGVLADRTAHPPAYLPHEKYLLYLMRKNRRGSWNLELENLLLLLGAWR